ncbi:MAG: L-2-amino-thiazoline-4-carboxylic acid hydrolase [Candidatus Thorarchaeota archaeon]
MIPEYEYYGTYHENASCKINLEEQIHEFLWNIELMFDYIETNKPEILESFREKVENKFTEELEGTSFFPRDVGLNVILEDQSILDSYTTIKELGLKLIMKYIPLEKGDNLSGKLLEVRQIDHLRAKHMLLYHRINSLVELLGREDGIQFFKDFVEYWGKKVAEKGRWKVTLKQARESLVPYWEGSDAFEFGVGDIDENMFLTKFDRCVWFESMKDVEEQELAYYTVCYPGPRVGKHAHEEILMRRSVTLFTGDFCDELRWNRHIHDNPEQPSHEFSSKIVPKEKSSPG